MTAPQVAPPTVLIVGDSLAVGTQPFLDRLLDHQQLTWDARSGRTTPQGLLALRADLRNITPHTIIVSLGTNDGSSPQRFASRARRLLQTVPPTACVVWPAISRAPRKGAYRGLNRVLRDLARHDHHLTVPAWDHAVNTRHCRSARRRPPRHQRLPLPQPPDRRRRQPRLLSSLAPLRPTPLPRPTRGSSTTPERHGRAIWPLETVSHLAHTRARIASVARRRQKTMLWR